MLDKLEGRFFVTFLSVLQEGSFSRSAEKLGYVQSTVTAHIQQLELACGQKLFNRMPRGVQPTEAGNTLAEYARQFRQLGTLLEEQMTRLEEPRGEVRLQTMESFCVTRLGKFLLKFFADFSEVSLRLETGFQEDIVEAALRHAIDYGIVPRDPGRDDLLFEPLITEPMVFVASRKLAEHANQADLPTLARERVIGFGPRCLYQTVAGSLLEEQGLRGVDHIEFPSTELIRQMISYGRGIAFLPRAAVQDQLESGDFAELNLIEPVMLTHGIISHRDRTLSAAAKTFKTELLAYMTFVMSTS
ncbi:LysR family transcriptional regulator [Cohnella sp.]|uniref:LysR family transcriptional regulator n=1 Tax=Cohnella sp. TaxID=1883426 RepID=UPI003564C3B9